MERRQVKTPGNRPPGAGGRFETGGNGVRGKPRLPWLANCCTTVADPSSVICWSKYVPAGSRTLLQSKYVIYRCDVQIQYVYTVMSHVCVHN